MKVLVTGSSGFIGRRLVAELLGQGHAVVGLDIREPDERPDGFVHCGCDLLDRGRMVEELAAMRPEVVIHLAAKTGLKNVPPGSEHFAANTRGTAHLMEAIRACGGVRRILYVSTKYVFRGPPPQTMEDVVRRTVRWSSQQGAGGGR